MIADEISTAIEMRGVSSTFNQIGSSIGIRVSLRFEKKPGNHAKDLPTKQTKL